MKLLSKITLTTVVIGGVSAGLYAAPGNNETPSGQRSNAGSNAGSNVGSRPTSPVTPVVMSPGQIKERASAIAKQVVSDNNLVVQMKQQARKSNDVIRLNCVNDKLVQIRPLLNLVDMHSESLAFLQDDGARSQAVESMSSAGESIRRLREEADQCAGEPASSSDTSNGWSGPQVPDDPFQEPFGEGVEPPGYASPFN